MMARFDMSNERLKMLWDAGHSVTQIKTEFGCHENTIRYRLKLMGLGNREKEAGVATNRGKRPPTQHLAAVRMPADPLEARADWPDLKAAVQRAKAGRAPSTSLAMVATKYRLPTAIVQGLAERLSA